MNIDAASDDPKMCSVFAADIYKNLRQAEVRQLELRNSMLSADGHVADAFRSKRF